MNRQGEGVEGADQVGPFHIDGECPEVGPELGALRTAHHEDGSPALVLTPAEDATVDWQLEAPWKMLVSCEHPDAVILQVLDAPPSGRTTKLTNVFALAYAALKRTEDNPWMDSHLTRGSRRLIQLWRRRTLALAFALGGVLLCCMGCYSVWGRASAPQSASISRSWVDGPALVNSDDPEPGAVSYPIPEQPFRNQAIAPCFTDRDEVELNGGCWLALKRKPPCLEVQAEHKGECWLPVSKDRKKTPRSQQQ